MKDTIKRIRKEREGFTLAELLIVVAIIAVLVAIAIPVFSAQLEKSREATDLANLRSAYAEASAAVLTGENTGNATYTAATGTTAAKAVATVELEQQVDGWVSTEHKCANVELSDDVAKKGKKVTVTVTDDGNDPTFAVAD